MEFETIHVSFQGTICYIQFYRPEKKNMMNSTMIQELFHILEECEEKANVIVLEGDQEFFCFGADFQEVLTMDSREGYPAENSKMVYQLLKKLTAGSYVTISHVKGKANAGGIGFVAASDVVIADQTAEFGLSELLFGLYPACVLPFLIRRIGYQKAHYFTMMTHPVEVEKAYEWGLVDAYGKNDRALLRKHLYRLERLPKSGIKNYKQYMCQLYDCIDKSEEAATNANYKMFSDSQNLKWIRQFIEEGKFPWQ
jgi:polyketide biosynthesis enoyl-CoA hydratase PksH